MLAEVPHEAGDIFLPRRQECDVKGFEVFGEEFEVMLVRFAGQRTEPLFYPQAGEVVAHERRVSGLSSKRRHVLMMGRIGPNRQPPVPALS